MILQPTKEVPKEKSLKIKQEMLTNSMEVIDLENDDTEKELSIIRAALNSFIQIKNNVYLNPSEKIISKDTKSMKCDCFLSAIQKRNRELGCTTNCINRLLYIECSNDCQCGKLCDNKSFQKSQNNHSISLFYAGLKGIGLRAEVDLPENSFLMEYIGEVLNANMVRRRSREYHREGNCHVYFMMLQSNLRIDATRKGNISRFLNHSCNPNAEAQKWTVNGELRIGFFTIKKVKKGEELTIDYQFNGKMEQKCHCGSHNCRGWLEKPSKNEDDLIEVEESSSSDESYSQPASVPKAVKKIPKIVTKASTEDSKQVSMLTNSGIKNKSQTLEFSRLIVRTKVIDLRLSLLSILKSADLPCRRLFLDCNGLRLLHNWMCDETDQQHSISHHLLHLELLNAFDLLPISNITMLRKSSVLEKVEKLAGINIKKKPRIEADNEDVLEELPTLKIKIKEKAIELLSKWMELKEEFKIPTLKPKDPVEIKKEPIEDIWDDSFALPTIPSPFPNQAVRYKKEFPKSTSIARRHSVYCPSPSPSVISRPSSLSSSSCKLSSELARQETERRMKIEHKKNCEIFNLPETTNPLNIPGRVNRATGEYFNIYDSKVKQPPNHNLLKAFYKPLPYDLSTDPKHYDLPPIELPKHWRNAIDTRGRIYYYHKKHRKSQWEPPVKNDESSSTDTEDSEEDMLNECLILLKKNERRMKKKKSSCKLSEKKKDKKHRNL